MLKKVEKKQDTNVDHGKNKKRFDDHKVDILLKYSFLLFCPTSCGLKSRVLD